MSALDGELGNLPGLVESLNATMGLLTELRDLVNDAEQSLIDYETMCYTSELRVVKVQSISWVFSFRFQIAYQKEKFEACFAKIPQKYQRRFLIVSYCIYLVCERSGMWTGWGGRLLRTSSWTSTALPRQASFTVQSLPFSSSFSRTRQNTKSRYQSPLDCLIFVNSIQGNAHGSN